MKKRVLCITIIITIFILQFLTAQNAIPPSAPQPSSSPLLGEINPQTGQPKNLETLQKYGDYYSNKEQNKSFLLKEWTKIFANNKYISPPLFYTEKFFSFFNPVWKIILGTEFSWSLAFFMIFAVWIGLIVAIYRNIDVFLHGDTFINALCAVVIASLVGISGGIKEGVELLATMIPNIWVFLAVLVIIAIIYWFFIIYLPNWAKEFVEAQEKNAREMRSQKERAYEKILDSHLTREGL